jgi:hypothetical protein
LTAEVFRIASSRVRSASYYRSKTRNSEQAKTSQQTCSAAKPRTDSSAFSGAFRPIIDAVAVAIDLFAGAVPVVRVVGDDADI